MNFDEVNKLYVDFMKLNGSKINNGTFLSHSLRREIRDLLNLCLEVYVKKPNDTTNIIKIIELNKTIGNDLKVLKYIDVLLVLDPKNRKYLNEKNKSIERLSSLKDLFISENEMIDLICFINSDDFSCSGKFTKVKQWTLIKNINFTKLKAWFNNNGIFCDCEVLLNMDEVIE